MWFYIDLYFSILKKHFKKYLQRCIDAKCNRSYVSQDFVKVCCIKAHDNYTLSFPTMRLYLVIQSYDLLLFYQYQEAVGQ